MFPRNFPFLKYYIVQGCISTLFSSITYKKNYSTFSICYEFFIQIFVSIKYNSIQYLKFINLFSYKLLLIFKLSSNKYFYTTWLTYFETKKLMS